MSTFRYPEQLHRVPKQIVVGTNGTPRALVGVEAAARLAADTGAELCVVAAYEPMSSGECARYAYQLGPLAYQLRGSNPADSDARDAVAHAALYGVSATRRVVRGRAVEVLRRVAKELRADLIVVPDVTHRGLAGLLKPSVATCLQHRAPCDVLLVSCRDAKPSPLFPSRDRSTSSTDTTAQPPRAPHRAPHAVRLHGAALRRSPSSRGRPAPRQPSPHPRDEATRN
jgi:nucleotide-binding universal stress UspA family protein